ncbi:MAG: tRNA (adenosine(37)-N6)-threonylcarbamoyltransferase complex transferase subunit TsaD [Candidatus Omnitrophica bacterium]|nr:tRNA (adenosine(37)-N6)-threonylcarbamoyltransferase complex transferase subunit TsaD [Candidatus Omnitrophota bacterium]
MYVLGIETSCDETSAAVVKDGRCVLSNSVCSSLSLHKKYGGVIPEIASRMQLETIAQVAQAALKDSGLTIKKIDLIAVTNSPGLPGSLLVGIAFAKSLSLAAGLPLVAVDHVLAHIYANFLDNTKVKLPIVALVASGGHTSLFYAKDFSRIETLGETQDDACGEAFDKVAKILGLGYPGGPIIEKLARSGDCKKFKFGCSGTRNPLDFSFSGVKTAVLYAVKGRQLSLKEKKDIAGSFQESAVGVLVDKSILACKKKKASSLVVGGGVAANNRLRERLIKEAGEAGIKCYFPPKSLCMDNAAMVAGLGYQLFKKGSRSDLTLTLD